MTLEERLRALAVEVPVNRPWRPLLFDLTDRARRSELERLLAAGAITSVRDTLDDQLAELVVCRNPRLHDAVDDVRARVAEQLAGVPPAHYGTWVLYPWSGRLAHLLPEREFREVRQARNRYKITASEQETLASRLIGVVGLSVGAAGAVTLAQEGVGRRFRLADFDRLALSNVNRLQAAVTEIGVPKVVLAARRMYEIDPYLSIEIWPEGLTEETADAFLTEGGPLDLLVEECDDLFVKIFVRERARSHRIPTIMDTNERGMLDVERFDLEPDRPVLHGLLDGVAAADLKGLTAAQKVPYVLRILGPTTRSPRFASSLEAIGRTLTSWPQLASGVALGAALVTDTARRILLERFTGSGRYFVDLDQLIADDSPPARSGGRPPDDDPRLSTAT